MGGINNEAQTFAAIITYFLMVTFLIGLSPLSNGTNFVSFTTSGSSCGSSQPWSATTSYGNGDCVTNGGKTWKSTANQNLNNLPSSSSNFWADQTSIGSGFSTTTKTVSGLVCAGTIAAGLALGFFTAGVTFIGVGATLVTCGFSLFAFLAPANLADSINTAVYAIFGFMFVFFELLTFQLPIPAFLNLLIIAPGAAPAVYIGLKVYRGGG